MVSLDHSERFSEAEGGEALRKLARQNKYEIKAVLWNPHMAKHQLMVSTVIPKGGTDLGLALFFFNAVSAEIGYMGCGRRKIPALPVYQGSHETCLVSVWLSLLD